MAAPTPAGTPRPALRLALLAAVVLAAGLLYVATAARDVAAGDSTEFVVVAYTLGVAHPPGYPLLTLLARLFTTLPLDPLPFRVNLTAAVFHALAVGLVYLTAERLTRRPLFAAIAAAILALDPLYWEWSLVVEVFSLSDLLAAALIYLVVLWQERPERPRYLILAALTGGLALANQLTIALLAPAVLYALWRARAAWSARPRLLALAAAAALVGLLPYAYLPWAAARDPLWNWGDIGSFGELVAHFLRSSYGTAQLVSGSVISGGSPLARIVALATSVSVVQAVLLVAGAVRAYRTMRWYFWFTLVGLTVSGPAFAAYANVDLSKAEILHSVLARFFLLPHVVAAPLAALGVAALAELASRAVASRRALAEGALAGIALAITFGAAAGAYPAIDQRENDVPRRYAEDIFASVRPNAMVVVDGDAPSLLLTYLQVVERRREDVALVLLALTGADWYVRELKRHRPDLVIPFDRYRGEPELLGRLLDANRSRPASLVLLGESGSGVLATGLNLGASGLALEVTRGPVPPLAEVVRENERLLALYRPPAWRATRPRSWERLIATDYALAPYRVGKQLEDARLHEDARRWYQRALAIDPELAEARAALARLAR